MVSRLTLMVPVLTLIVITCTTVIGQRDTGSRPGRRLEPCRYVRDVGDGGPLTRSKRRMPGPCWDMVTHPTRRPKTTTSKRLEPCRYVRDVGNGGPLTRSKRRMPGPCWDMVTHPTRRPKTTTSKSPERIDQERMFNGLSPDEKMMFATVKSRLAIYEKNENADHGPSEPEIKQKYPQYRKGTALTRRIQHGCCPEIRSLFIADSTMENVGGTMSTILHFDFLKPPMYQFVEKGICVDKGGTYSDHGHCHQGMTTISLLVRIGYIVRFDLFKVPAYCKCLHY